MLAGPRLYRGLVVRTLMPAPRVHASSLRGQATVRTLAGGGHACAGARGSAARRLGVENAAQAPPPLRRAHSTATTASAVTVTFDALRTAPRSQALGILRQIEQGANQKTHGPST